VQKDLPAPKLRPPLAQKPASDAGEVRSEIYQPADLQALEARVLDQIGQDLKNLGSEMAIDELNRFARHSLSIERPDLFRQVMVAEVDAHWGGLSDARTALNMIAWLPDTADYLSARITAARLAISGDQLPEIEAERLWRDLRARVERVGDNDLLVELADAMIRSSSADLLVDTVNRFHRSERLRLQSFVHLLKDHGPRAPQSVNTMLYNAISEIRTNQSEAFYARQIAQAYWAIGRHAEAMEALKAEPDALLRLRTRFELLADLPPASSTEDEVPEPAPSIRENPGSE
jgi:hypothetical protein